MSFYHFDCLVGSASWRGLFLSVAGTALFGQNGPGPKGRGYSGPPQSQEERAARQASCLQTNGGVCPNGGPRADCPRRGMGQGNGAGQGWRHGLRDGTGPRSANGTCPLNNSAQSQKQPRLLGVQAAT